MLGLGPARTLGPGPGQGPARSRAHGPLPIGPWALANGPLPIGPWALAHWPMGPGPWALAHWTMGPGPWAHGPWPIGALGSPGDQNIDFSKSLGMALPGVEMSGYLGGVFLSYLEPTNSHIIKHISQNAISPEQGSTQ